jgi:hypothetical protein
MKFIAVLMIPAGSIAGGLLATAFGLHAAIWVGSIGALFSFVPALVSPLRGLRTIPTEVAGEAAQVGAAGAAGADAATAPAAPRSPLVEPSPEPMLGEID